MTELPRWIPPTATVLGAVLLVNGLAMLLASERWFAIVASHTGAWNGHFVRDVGAAYVAAGTAAIWAARRPARGGPLIVVAAIFLGLHALGHAVETGMGWMDPVHLVADLPGVFLPPILLGVMAPSFFHRETPHREASHV